MIQNLQVCSKLDFSFISKACAATSERYQLQEQEMELERNQPSGISTRALCFVVAAVVGVAALKEHAYFNTRVQNCYIRSLILL